MTVKVTLEFDTAADAAAFLQDFDAPTSNGDAPKAARRGRPPKAAQEAPAAAAAAPAAQPAAAVSAAPPPAATVTAPATVGAPAAVPFKDVADAITSLAEINRDKAVALLGQFGASRANELKPEQYAAFVAEAKKALAPAPTTSLI